MRKKITIVDYGSGNLLSAQQSFIKAAKLIGIDAEIQISNNPKNLEKITRIFFRNRRKMIKKPFNQIFNGDLRILQKLKINLNLRPQNLNFETYYKLTEEYEKLLS